MIQVAGQQFKVPVVKSCPKRTPDYLKLWDMPIPRSNNYSYQFWVINLKGRNAQSFFDGWNVNERAKFSKFESLLVEFFGLQFDSMRSDKMENIHLGMKANCETIYILAYNLARADTLTIVGTAQYNTSPAGVWINWLGLSAEVHPDIATSKKTRCSSILMSGSGYVFPNLIQFQQVSKGWSERVFLQTLISSLACQYYQNRGYIKAPKNDIKSIPGIDDDPFVDHRLHFILDDMQLAEGAQPDESLCLFY